VPTNVIMPALARAQETGKVLRWLKALGDRVDKGDPIVEIETDKVTVAPRHEVYLPPNAGPTVIAT
jgi:pyruvate/2-oxoglutarate dehydrogenase complex dihydrolipoamide acyltransferase (E2) component